MNAVAPGPTDTGMLDRFTGTERRAGLVWGLPLRRVGTPTSSRTPSCCWPQPSSFTTGQILSVDGVKSAA